MAREILIEGYTEAEILALPPSEWARRRPLAASNALAHIDGGGEGVLMTISALDRRWARLEGLQRIKWTVHAVHCAKPNPKLRTVLERLGFRVSSDGGVEAYRLSDALGTPVTVSC